MSWRRCSSCRSEIDFGAVYWECSVSTCTRPRTGFYFCSVGCWEVHLPELRHREAWAVEKRAPSEAQWRAEEAAQAADRPSDRPPPAAARPTPAPAARPASAPAGRPAPAPLASRVVASSSDGGAARRVVAPAGGAAVEPAGEVDESDVLVVVSKLKKYVRARSGMNTSDGVTDVLSAHLRRICDLAIRKAAEEGRKTVLDRDFRAIL